MLQVSLSVSFNGGPPDPHPQEALSSPGIFIFVCAPLPKHETILFTSRQVRPDNAIVADGLIIQSYLASMSSSLPKKVSL